MLRKERKPNLIWVFGDQHRGQALSSMGDGNVKTPNIDLLASDGVNFINARSGFPLCCPFRGSLLTSIYPHKCVPGHEYRMDPNQKTIADVFNEHGYESAYFGKWHLDGFKESEGRAAFHKVPRDRRGGFTHWLGYENNNSQWDSWLHGHYKGREKEHFRLPGYETDSLTDLFISYLAEMAEEQKTSEKPFFAVLSVQPPHNPYHAPADYMSDHKPTDLVLRPNVPCHAKVRQQAKNELAGYYAQIENLDYNLGRIMSKLSDSQLLENTHVLFFSDHGDSHGSHGLFRKTNPYEESVRIPFIVGGAGRRYAPYITGESDLLINHVDIAPTSLGLCDITPPVWMEGTDYSFCRLSDKERENIPDSIFMQSVVSTGHYNSIEEPWRGLVSKDGWKFVSFQKMPWLLFNLKDDPYEQVNLAHNVSYSDIRLNLKQKLEQWIKSTGDDFKLLY